MDELNNYINILKDCFNKLSIEHDDNKITKIIYYVNHVMEFNSHTNITGSKSMEDFIEYHIIDSLLAHCFFKNAKTVIDVGAGAGLPSIPLSIIYDNIEFSLCESKPKKCKFLFSVKEELNLNNIIILNQNVYEIKNKYDIITARAFSDMKTLIKIYNRLRKKNSRLVSYKGKLESINEEIESLSKKIDIEIIPLEYSSLDKERHILLYKS